MGARDLWCDDNGEIRLYEDSDNGTAYVGHKATADMTSGGATYTVTWPDAAPGSELFMKMDASGIISFNSGASDTLDAAYDSGGAGAGRIITADTGPVEAAGSGGFLVSHSAPVYGLETTGTGEYNYRITCGQSTDIFEIQRGDQDADISDDTFDAFFALDGPNLRLGLNTVAPGTLAHFVSPSGNAAATIEAPTGSDASVVFTEDSTARFEVGYDQSAGGLVLGRLSFSNPAIFIEDSTGSVGINTVTPGYDVDIVGLGGSESGVRITVSGASALHCLALQNDSSGASDSADIVGTDSEWRIDKDGDATFGLQATDDTTVEIRAAATNSSILQFVDGGGVAGILDYDHTVDQLIIDIAASQWGDLRAAGLVIGTVAGGTVDGTNTIALVNGTAPSDTPDNGVTLYAEDVTASSELKVRDEAGNVTVLSPHSEAHGHRLSEDMAWSFYSERAGCYIWVDMLRVIRVLEGLSGEELAHIGVT